MRLAAASRSFPPYVRLCTLSVLFVLTCGAPSSLIMLMIFSDFYKASWQLIYPAVVFTKGAVSSESRFCQTAGFMMSMGIEASGMFFLFSQFLCIHVCVWGLTFALLRFRRPRHCCP